MVWTYQGSLHVWPSISLSFGANGIGTSVKSGDLPDIPSGLIIDPNKPAHHSHGVDSNIFSVAVDTLTNPNLNGIKQAILNVHKQREILKHQIVDLENELKRYKSRRLWSQILLFGLLMKSYRGNLKQSIDNQEEALAILKSSLLKSHVALEVSFVPELKNRYDLLSNNFKALTASKKLWDVTASYYNDRVVTRSAASTTIVRREVSFRMGHLPDIKCEIPAMVWHNANGADLYFYPSFLIAWNNRESFAVIGIDELDMNCTFTRFVEDESVPADSKVIDKTWAKVNKNGTPDRRFTNNYQIPIAKYGRLEIKTKNGLNEEYMVSNCEATEAYATAFFEYQVSVIKLEYIPKVRSPAV